MSRLMHQAIVVTSWLPDHIEKAHKAAVRIYSKPGDPFEGDWSDLVSPILPVVVNGGGTFVVVPDGSKEGWSTSDEGDRRRAKFITWLKTRSDLYVDWVEVTVGGDATQRITASGKGGER